MILGLLPEEGVLERDKGHTCDTEGFMPSPRLLMKLPLGLWKCDHGKRTLLPR